MRLAITLILLVSSLIATPAMANRWPDAQVNTAMQVADNHWPDSQCYGQHQLTWFRSDAFDVSANVDPKQEIVGVADMGVPCRVWIAWDRIDTIRMLCSVLEHEYGHNAGQEHSENFTDVMYPAYMWDTTDCIKAFPHKKRKKHLHS